MTAKDEPGRSSPRDVSPGTSLPAATLSADARAVKLGCSSTSCDIEPPSVGHAGPCRCLDALGFETRRALRAARRRDRMRIEELEARGPDVWALLQDAAGAPRSPAPPWPEVRQALRVALLRGGVR
jgi:hypothetical protein